MEKPNSLCALFVRQESAVHVSYLTSLVYQRTQGILDLASLVMQPLYRALRGEMETEEFARRVQTEKSCCADTACTVKIYRCFQRLKTPDEKATTEDLLKTALATAILCVTGKGGSESTIIESIFSICRMLALRLMALGSGLSGLMGC